MYVNYEWQNRCVRCEENFPKSDGNWCKICHFRMRTVEHFSKKKREKKYID